MHATSKFVNAHLYFSAWLSVPFVPLRLGRASHSSPFLVSLPMTLIYILVQRIGVEIGQ